MNVLSIYLRVKLEQLGDCDSSRQKNLTVASVVKCVSSAQLAFVLLSLATICDSNRQLCLHLRIVDFLLLIIFCASLCVCVSDKSGKFPAIQPLFISVDPERDTPDKIKAYLAG